MGLFWRLKERMHVKHLTWRLTHSNVLIKYFSNQWWSLRIISLLAKSPVSKFNSLTRKLGLWFSEMSTNIQISVTSSHWDNPRPLRKMFNEFYLYTRDSEVNCFSSLVTSQLKWWFTSTPFSPSGTPIMRKLYAWWFPKGLWGAAHFSSFLFLSVPQTG